MNYRREFDAIEKQKPRPRGFAFERLINKVFDDCKVLINDSYKTSDEAQQIDGAIEINGRIFLLEAKWEDEDTLAASKLYSFLGKINSKIEGTLGVFISYNKLKDNFVDAVRNGLRQNCILIHGKDNIIDIVEGKLDLAEFVWHCYRQASTNNRADISTSEFVSLPYHTPIKNLVSTGSYHKDGWALIYSKLTDKTPLSDFTASIQTDFKIGTGITQNLINILPTLTHSVLETKKLQSLIELIIEKEESILVESLVSKFKGTSWRKYADSKIIDLMPKLNLNTDEVSKIIDNVTAEMLGDYDKENAASRILKKIENSFSFENYMQAANKYLDIYIDSTRESRFEQKKFAKEVFSKLESKGVNILDFIEKELYQDLELWKNDDKVWNPENDQQDAKVKNNIISTVLYRYKNILDGMQLEKAKEKLLMKFDQV